MAYWWSVEEVSLAGMPKPSLQGRIHGVFRNRPSSRARVVPPKEQTALPVLPRRLGRRPVRQAPPFCRPVETGLAHAVAAGMAGDALSIRRLFNKMFLEKAVAQVRHPVLVVQNEIHECLCDR